MTTPQKLAVYVVALVAAFGAAFGAGRTVGPTDDARERDTPDRMQVDERPVDHLEHGS